VSLNSGGKGSGRPLIATGGWPAMVDDHLWYCHVGGGGDDGVPG
jgi:hypothetical protein